MTELPMHVQKVNHGSQPCLLETRRKESVKVSFQVQCPSTFFSFLVLSLSIKRMRRLCLCSPITVIKDQKESASDESVLLLCGQVAHATIWFKGRSSWPIHLSRQIGRAVVLVTFFQSSLFLCILCIAYKGNRLAAPEVCQQVCG